MDTPTKKETPPPAKVKTLDDTAEWPALTSTQIAAHKQATEQKTADVNIDKEGS